MSAEVGKVATAPLENKYEFSGGYPTDETIQRAYDEADMNRAVMAYRFFYPTVSIMGTWKGNMRGGCIPNKAFALLEGTPQQLVFTPNSDTPYAGLPLDLSIGPIVIELPPRPLMSSTNDMNQLWVLDAGLPGPDKGKGGKHLFLPPGYKVEVPAGYNIGRPTTNRVLVLLRALPLPDKTPNEIMQSVKIYPLNETRDLQEPTWISLNHPGLDFTPLQWENNLQYWQELYELIDSEPAYEGYRYSSGAYLDGSKAYKLTVPQPVPGKLFWSVTVYDTETRSEIATDQNYAALRSMFELKDLAKDGDAELYFGPKAPVGEEKRWIKTIPGKGWFVYFRIYGPEGPAFDGSWRPGDFREVT